jgi:hypothetical protein
MRLYDWYQLPDRIGFLRQVLGVSESLLGLVTSTQPTITTITAAWLHNSTWNVYEVK